MLLKTLSYCLIYHYLSVSLPLVWRQYHNAGQVVVIGHLLILGEVPADNRARLRIFGKHVKEKRGNIIVEGLVIQKELR